MYSADYSTGQRIIKCTQYAKHLNFKNFRYLPFQQVMYFQMATSQCSGINKYTAF